MIRSDRRGHLTFDKRIDTSLIACAAFWLLGVVTGLATPANKAALERHYDTFLGKDLNRCTTCHLPSPVEEPQNLDEFPHNPFGDRLRSLGEELSSAGKRKDIATRLRLVAAEDSDGDGFSNETELLAGANPGDARQMPAAEQLADVEKRRDEFEKLLASYRWQPLDRVQRPPIPQVKTVDWVRNPIDAFIAAEHEQRGLKPRPGAPRSVLLRRVYLDLIGLSPTPDEQRAFEEDHSSDAYEKVVDRLLDDPRHGERWARHWMDIWRYSDWAGWTDGKQVRDSQRHVWRWRDWIVESLNEDKGYDRMVTEMLAADEVAPDDPNALRATGFLVRNYKMLSREQWLEDTVKHTIQAFLGVTIGCAKCHDHKTEPISQMEYYQVRAIFEPHQVRTDRVPGQLDIEKDGLARVYDADPVPPTYLFVRGDERKPDKERVIQPAVPRALCGDKLKPALEVARVDLPRTAAFPDRREFVIKETVAASEQALEQSREALAKAKADVATKPEQLEQRQLEVALLEAKRAALQAVIEAEQLEIRGDKGGEHWRAAATEAVTRQRAVAQHEAQLALRNATLQQTEAQRRADDAAAAQTGEAKKSALEKATKDLEAARQKVVEATQALGKADEQAKAAPGTDYKPHDTAAFPGSSTGRRQALARWITHCDNPLTARVAMNHLWLRHFGRGIVITPENFGTNGARPSHPALLDWLAAEFMADGWKMKAMHRMIVTSNTYRMASTPDEEDARIDIDNTYFWRMPSKRMEAELVRDNLLYVAGTLDSTRGGPDIDHMQGLTSKRRSIYLRTAAEKEVEFLKIFDSASVNECYQRRATVMPQQALALANSELARAEAKVLATRIGTEAGDDDALFAKRVFEWVLARTPRPEELNACREFLRGRSAGLNPAGSALPIKIANLSPAEGSNSDHARENLVLVLFNHNDFVTIR
jgi:hypothetical protein